MSNIDDEVDRCAHGCTLMDIIKVLYVIAGLIFVNGYIFASSNGITLLITIPIATTADSIILLTYIAFIFLRYVASGLSCVDYWLCCRFDEPLIDDIDEIVLE